MCDSSKHETVVDSCKGQFTHCGCRKTMCSEHRWYVRCKSSDTGWHEVCYFCEDETREKKEEDDNNPEQQDEESKKEETKEVVVTKLQIVVRLIWGYYVRVDISPKETIEKLRKRAWENRKIPDHQAIEYNTYCSASKLCCWLQVLNLSDLCSTLHNDDYLIEVAKSWTMDKNFNSATLTVATDTTDNRKKEFKNEEKNKSHKPMKGNTAITKEKKEEEEEEETKPTLKIVVRLIWGYNIRIDISPKATIEELRHRAWQKRNFPEHSDVEYATYCMASELCLSGRTLVLSALCSTLYNGAYVVEDPKRWTQHKEFNITTLTLPGVKTPNDIVRMLATTILTTFMDSKEDYSYIHESDNKVRGELHGLCKEKNMACYTIYEGTTRVWTCDHCGTIQDQPETCHYDEPSDVYFSCCKCYEHIGFCSEYESLKEDYKDGRLTVKNWKSTGRMFIKRPNVRYKPKLPWNERFKHNYRTY